jgi:hypothetical protein
MTKPLSIPLFLVLSLSFDGQAQTSPARKDLRDAAAAVDCEVLAKQPSPAMTVEACRAQQAAYGGLGQAVNTPGGERPGDESMSCAQIIAEMKSSHFAGVSAETAQAGVVAGQQLQDTYQRRMALAGTMGAQHMGESMAVAAAPNAVQGAVMYKQTAEQQALARDAAAEMQPVRTRAMMANAASADELAANLQANPRFARLMQLVMQKNCQYSDAPPGSTP